MTARCSTGVWLLVGQILLGLVALGASQVAYKVPNPFAKLTEKTANDFYYIKAEQLAHEHEELVEEYFSLGLGLTYSIHRDVAGKSAPWALLVDGRSARSYILRDFDSWASSDSQQDEIDCELDHLHHHKQLFPWQYAYDVSGLIQGSAPAKGDAVEAADPVGLMPELDGSWARQKRKKTKRRSRSMIYGVGAVWLNLIDADTRSDLVGANSPYATSDIWKLKAKNLEVEMTFKRQSSRLPDDSEALQALLDAKSTPNQLKIHVSVPYNAVQLNHFDKVEVKRFKSGLKEDDEEQLKDLRFLLDRCKRSNRRHRLFPNLMRALASSSERAYKIDYVTHRYNLYGAGELDGKFSEQHHRYMWPYELTNEVLSLAQDVQTIMYNPGFMKSQELSRNGERVDVFMARYTENAQKRSARHASAHYHLMFFDEETAISCKIGEREPKPKYRLLSSSFTFMNEFGTEFQGHIHGLGALLLNAAHLHYKSFSLFNLEIRVPISEHDLDERRTVMTNVWQVYDKRDKVRVLFFFEKRNPSREQLSWDLADRDRKDLSRLVRVDLREAHDGDETSMAIDQETVERDDNLLAQYFILNFAFEVPESEAYAFLSVPIECRHSLPGPEPDKDDEDKSNQGDDSSDEDDNESLNDDTANSYDKEYDGDDDEDKPDDSDGEHSASETDAAAEFELLTGLEEQSEELPEFIEMLADQTSYKFVTRLELLDDDDDGDDAASKDVGSERKSIWMVEVMDLASEKLSLKIYLSRESLERDEPVEQYFIFYESELMFRLNEGKRCRRLEELEVSSKWLRLFSGHLVYYLAMPTHGHKLDEKDLANNDLVVETNRMSSYGLGALWRRTSESGLANFLGVRRQRVTRDGKTYKQLVWSYEEFDMTIKMTFLVEEGKLTRRLAKSKPQLESVLITNQFGEELLSNFKQVKAVVETFEVGVSSQVIVPFECRDQVIEAQRMIEHDKPIYPPSYQEVIGDSDAYELQYTVFSYRGMVRQRETEVRESFDLKQNRGKIVIDAYDPDKALEIYIDGNAKRMFAMSQTLGKCTILTELAPTYNTLLSTLVFDNPNYEPDKLHGLMGLWQALAKREAKLVVRQINTFSGETLEEQLYSIVMTKPGSESGGGEKKEEVKLYFDKRRPVDYGGTSFSHDDKVRIRQQDDLRLDWIEFKPVKNRLNQHDDDAEHVSVNLVNHQDHLSGDWKLPQACQDLIRGQDSNSGKPADDSSGEVKPDTPETKPLTGYAFPKLSDLFARTSRFHMHGEVTIRGAMNRVYLVEELYQKGDVRLRTHGLGKEAEKNCDLLMFQDSLDQFDISKPLRCIRLLEDKTSHCLHMSLFDVWMGHMARVETLASLHYGPLSLWQLGERSATQAKLIKTISLKPDESTDESLATYKQHLEREMDREVWLVSAKDSGHSGGWSYQMEFVKHQTPIASADGDLTGFQEWHVLESITASDSIDGNQFSVFIDVVNYNYTPDDDLFKQMFFLPEGWNCRRMLSGQVERPFELDLDVSANVRLSYEASLELLDVDNEQLIYEDDVELGPLRVRSREVSSLSSLPTLVGAFLTSGDLNGFPASLGEPAASISTQAAGKERRFDLSVDQSITRFVDGRVSSRRLITDRQMPIEYELDSMTGTCKMRVIQNPGWHLDFPTPDGKQVHRVPMFSIGDLSQVTFRDLFKQLFLDNFDKEGRRQFFLVNRFDTENEYGKIRHASYEREFDILRFTENLAGPGRIVRKYEQQEFLSPFGKSSEQEKRRVSFMTAQAYLLSQDKTKLRAILTMRLEINPPAGLTEFLSLSSVADCFNQADELADRQLGSFTLEYPMANQFDSSVGHSTEPLLVESFYGNLLRAPPVGNNQLLPLQLDGRAHLEFSQHDRLARFHFNVLEAPSAMVYFNQRFQCTMNERMEAVSESRILPNVEACSRWCDQVNCLAMSYCDDHLCRVATRAGIFGSSRRRKDKSPVEEAADLVSLAACASHEACTYYFNKMGVRPLTLEGFRNHLDRVVNFRSNSAHLKALSLPFDLQMTGFLQVHNRVPPSNFYKSSEMFRWQREDYENPFQVDTSAGDDLFSPASDASMTSADLPVAAGSFALWRPLSQFDENRIDALNDELGQGHDSKFIMTWAVAAGQASCLKECQRNQCLLVASCRKQNRCQMIIPTGHKSILALERLKQELVIPSTAECSISIRDHLDKFHLFEDTQQPANFWHRVEGYTAQECAAACYLNQAECLAFDICAYRDEQDAALGEKRPTTVCFLQRDHVTQDSFDRAILLPKWDSERLSASERPTQGERQMSCDHYSRSVVAEFQRVPNMKLRELHESTLRGISVDKCAADCLQDDACRAFEHCLNPRRSPTQSCYLIRTNNDKSNTEWLSRLSRSIESRKDGSSESAEVKYLGEHLVLSKTCSVYVEKVGLMVERAEQTLGLAHKYLPDVRFSGARIVTILTYLLLSTLVGAAVQFAHIRLRGRALSLR